MRRSIVIAAGLVVLAVVGGGVIWQLTRTPQTATQKVSGEALIGGPFELVSHEGETVSDEDFRGQWMVVFFGFTYCPDVCPIDLNVMTAAYDRLSEGQRANLQPIFISVDPERDTVEVVADYVELFHEDLLGLTGDPEAVAEAADAYRVYYKKTESEEGADDYLIDHSAFTYVMDEEGEYVTHFAHGTTPEEMAERLGELIPAG